MVVAGMSMSQSPHAGKPQQESAIAAAAPPAKAPSILSVYAWHDSNAAVSIDGEVVAVLEVA